MMQHEPNLKNFRCVKGIETGSCSSCLIHLITPYFVSLLLQRFHMPAFPAVKDNNEPENNTADNDSDNVPWED